MRHRAQLSRRFDLYGGKRFVLADKRLALLFAAWEINRLAVRFDNLGSGCADFFRILCGIIPQVVSDSLFVHPEYDRRLALAHASVDELFRPLASGLDRQLKFLWLDEALADEMANLFAYGDKYIARQFGECVIDAAHAALSARG
jgi:hypothetical protein